MVLPDGTPTPGLAEFAAVNAPVLLSVAGADADRAQPPAHRRPPTGCASSPWSRSRAIRSRDHVDVPTVGPGGERRGPARRRPADAAAGRDLADRPRRAGRGHRVGTGRARGGLGSVRPRRRPRAPGSTADLRARAAPSDRPTDDRVAPVAFDARTGRVTLAVRPPGRRPVARAVARADRQRPQRRARVVRAGCPGRDRRPWRARSVVGGRWRAAGLDRLVHRVQEVTSGDDRRVVRVHSSAANSALGVDTRYRWRWTERRDRAGRRDRAHRRLDLHLAPGRHPPRPARRPSTGPTGSAPGRPSPIRTRPGRRGWAGSPPPSTPCRCGYSRPQETGHRAAVRRLDLADGVGGRSCGSPPGPTGTATGRASP